MTAPVDTPNPGSEAARAQGCTCPVVDNHYGVGIPTKGEPLFWFTAGCPVHAPLPAPPEAA